MIKKYLITVKTFFVSLWFFQSHWEWLDHPSGYNVTAISTISLTKFITTALTKAVNSKYVRSTTKYLRDIPEHGNEPAQHPRIQHSIICHKQRQLQLAGNSTELSNKPNKLGWRRNRRYQYRCCQWLEWRY